MFNLNLQKPSLKIIPFGGVGNVTKNMYVYEYADEILVVDCGVGFPDEGMPGIDLVIPDVSYLLENKQKIKAFLVTHGHDDHIGAFPYIIKDFLNIPIYGSRLVASFIEDKFKEIGLNKKVEILQKDQTLQFKFFRVDHVHVTHSIPDTLHYIIETPVGRVYHGSDFKIDYTPVDENPPELVKIARFGEKGIHLLLSDCLGAERPGATLSERVIEETFEHEIADCPGKFIVTTQSSNISRLKQAINVGLRNNRNIGIVGRSMEKNLEAAQNLKYLDLPSSRVVDLDDISKYPPQSLLLLVAGSQGQESSALTRIANDEHQNVKLKEGDVVVFSSEPIPGNENNVYNLIDTITKLGVRVSYSDVRDELHVSGHGSQNDLLLLMSLTKPKFLYPIGGTFRHMQQYSLLGRKMGYDPKQIILGENGRTVEVTPQNVRLDKKIDFRNIMIDGLGVGDIGNVVLRDRKQMSADGIVVVIVPYDENSGQIVGDPDVISRGFVYMKESEELIEEAKNVIKSTLKNHQGKSRELHFFRRTIEDSLKKFFFKKTKRNPLVIAVLLEV